MHKFRNSRYDKFLNIQRAKSLKIRCKIEAILGKIIELRIMQKTHPTFRTWMEESKRRLNRTSWPLNSSIHLMHTRHICSRKPQSKQLCKQSRYFIIHWCKFRFQGNIITIPSFQQKGPISILAGSDIMIHHLTKLNIKVIRKLKQLITHHEMQYYICTFAYYNTSFFIMKCNNFQEF